MDCKFDEKVEQRIVDGLAEFAAGAGHELNNPLAIISGIAQNLLRTQTNEDVRRSLASIIEQTRRAYEMIADIRSFSRPPKPEIRSFNVSEFFNRWVEREKKRANLEPEKIQVESCDRVDAVVETDEAILAAILDSIGKNALEAIDADGRLLFFWNLLEQDDVVDFNCENESRDTSTPVVLGKKYFLEIGVEDSGIGISDDEQRLLFAPFFSSRQAGRGLGFGLSKAWRYAEVLGLRLRYVKSQMFDSGCRWIVEVPLT